MSNATYLNLYSGNTSRPYFGDASLAPYGALQQAGRRITHTTDLLFDRWQQARKERNDLLLTDNQVQWLRDTRTERESYEAESAAHPYDFEKQRELANGYLQKIGQLDYDWGGNEKAAQAFALQREQYIDSASKGIFRNIANGQLADSKAAWKAEFDLAGREKRFDDQARLVAIADGTQLNKAESALAMDGVKKAATLHGIQDTALRYPRQFVEQIERGDYDSVLTAPEQLHYLNQSKREIAKSQEAVANDWLMKLYNGQPIDKDLLDQQVKSGAVPEVWASRFWNNYEKELERVKKGAEKEEVFVQEDWDFLNLMVEGYEPQTDEWGQSRADLRTAIAASPLPKAYKQVIEGRLKEKEEAPEKKSSRNATQLRAVLNERANALLDGGLFGEFDFLDSGSNDGGYRTTEAYNAAVWKKEDFKRRMNDWVDDHPDASLDDLQNTITKELGKSVQLGEIKFDRGNVASEAVAPDGRIVVNDFGIQTSMERYLYDKGYNFPKQNSGIQRQRDEEAARTTAEEKEKQRQESLPQPGEVEAVLKGAGAEYGLIEEAVPVSEAAPDGLPQWSRNDYGETVTVDDEGLLPALPGQPERRSLSVKGNDWEGIKRQIILDGTRNKRTASQIQQSIAKVRNKWMNDNAPMLTTRTTA